jgi:hypothetical protein
MFENPQETIVIPLPSMTISPTAILAQSNIESFVERRWRTVPKHLTKNEIVAVVKCFTSLHTKYPVLEFCHLPFVETLPEI